MSVKILTITLAIFTICQASDPFDDVLADPEKCYSNCTETYKSSGLTEECERGCRFHVIEDFISSGPNVTVCYGTCIEAYGTDNPRMEACKGGCSFERKIEELNQPKDEGASIHLLSPLMQVRAVYSSVVGAVQVIRTSLITYFISDDNSIVAVESEPEIVIGIPEENPQDAETLLAEQQAREMTLNDNTGDPSVVKTITRRMGIPRYVLGASVIAIAVFCMYIIIAFLHARSSKAKAYARERSVQINPSALPVKLVRPEDLTKLSFTEEDDLEAPALPTKVKLPDTMI